MRAGLLRYLRCPTCTGALSVSGRQDAAGAVMEGDLACLRCRHVYPIRQGVPRFTHHQLAYGRAETVRTPRAYDFTWRRVSRRELEQGWEKDSYQCDALIPHELISGLGKVGMDAGCGGGADLARLAQRFEFTLKIVGAGRPV